VSTTTKPALMEAITSASIGQRHINAGDKLAADDPLVKSHRGWFIDVDAPDAVKREAAAKLRWDPLIEQAKAVAVPLPEIESLPVRHYEYIWQPRRIRVGKELRDFYPGTTVSPDSELVRRYPYAFRPVTEPAQ
jgi:hypothetical protein